MSYGTMQDRIAREIGRSDLTTQIRDAIQTAIRYYERKRFYFNEFQASFSASTSQEYYDSTDLSQIPNLVEIDSLTVDVNNTTYPLTERDWSYIDRVQTNAGYTGDPTDYVYYAQRLRMYPIPYTGRTFNISGVEKLATLSATADTNAWMTDAEALIRSHAKAHLYRHVIQKPEQAQEMYSEARQEVSNLEGEQMGKQSMRLRPTAF